MEAEDELPAVYHCYEASNNRRNRVICDPFKDITRFLETELSLGDLPKMLNHLWLAGAKHPARQLHLQVAFGREIVVADRMDLHLLWDNDGRVFIKPLPAFLLDPDFWKERRGNTNDCTSGNGNSTKRQWILDHNISVHAETRQELRKVALGFLYTYACLVCSEMDFAIANEKRLLPRGSGGTAIEWSVWKKFVREVLSRHDNTKIHPRFWRSELRLSRINTINRLITFPHPRAYHTGSRNYSGPIRRNITWMATAAVLTAMQVGLATEKLTDNGAFQSASYGFTIFTLVGILGIFGIVALIPLLYLARDVPSLIVDRKRRPAAGNVESGVVGS